MGWFDSVSGEQLGETALNVAGVIPLLGNAVGVAELIYHGIADDESTPEARAQHQSNMQRGFVGSIPLLGEAADAVQLGYNAAETVSQGSGNEHGGSAGEEWGKYMFPHGADVIGAPYGPNDNNRLPVAGLQ